MLELLADGGPDRGTVDAEPAGDGEAVLAEAQPEQEARTLAEPDEVALVVIAVLEPVIVQRLGEDGRHLVPGDVGDERAHVRPHVRVRGAQVGRIRVAEGVLRARSPGTRRDGRDGGRQSTR